MVNAVVLLVIAASARSGPMVPHGAPGAFKKTTPPLELMLSLFQQIGRHFGQQLATLCKLQAQEPGSLRVHQRLIRGNTASASTQAGHE